MRLTKREREVVQTCVEREAVWAEAVARGHCRIKGNKRVVRYWLRWHERCAKLAAKLKDEGEREGDDE